MSTIVPPPTRPPGSGSLLSHNLDDLKDKFWATALEELEANSASLSEDCEGPLRSFISEAANRFLEASSVKQNLAMATINLRHFVRYMVEESKQGLVASRGDTGAMVTIDYDVFYATLQNARRRGWSFWPFS
jgi:hypothetical protein